MLKQKKLPKWDQQWKKVNSGLDPLIETVSDKNCKFPDLILKQLTNFKTINWLNHKVELIHVGKKFNVALNWP